MFPVLFMLLCVVVLMVVMGPMARHRSRGYKHRERFPAHNRAFDILDQRLATGEIDKAEYDEKRRTIAQDR